MAISHLRSQRSSAGGRYKKARKKKQYELGRVTTLSTIGEQKKRMIRTMGANRKIRLLEQNVLNLYDPSTKKSSKVKIKTVLENPANRHYVRRNYLTKGTIVDTEKGKARITSRPGQEGNVNAVLIP